MKYDWSNKEQLIKDLQQSYSMSDFLKKNNFSTTAGSTQTFKDKVEAHNINLENIFLRKNFIPRTRIEASKFPNKEELLCTNSKFPRSFIRKYIKENSIIPYVCRKCGNNGTWQGEPLTLELEHKNGITSDNRLENLEYLCLNCHSQTLTYRSRNLHLKTFNKRIKDLRDIKIVDENDIGKLAALWDIRIISVKDWISTYRDKISEHGVQIKFRESTSHTKEEIINQVLNNSYDQNDSLKDVSQKLGLHEQDAAKIIRIYNSNYYTKIKNEIPTPIEAVNIEYKNKVESLYETTLENYLNILPTKWGMSEKEVTLWIKKNAYEYYMKILKHEGEQELISAHKKKIQREVNRIDSEESRIERINDVLNSTNKKQVSELAKKWTTSVNGAKKWIRNNLPDKFAEIYDDKHLVKNKQKMVQQERENYVKSLQDNFNVEQAMLFLNTNKSGLFSLITKYNPTLLNQLHSKHPCPKCNSKTRTNGKYQRCTSCNHNFYPPNYN